MDSKKIGSFISELRKLHNWTQGELASRLNVSDKTVSKWEGGNGLPDISILPDLAHIFGITVDELLKGEAKRVAANESIYAKIAAGDLELTEEIEKGLKYDGLDEYGKSLADYCAIKNNIKVFHLLMKLNKVYIANRTETRSNMNMRPTGKETLTCENVMIFDQAYYTGKYDNPYSKNYSDSALFCLLVKNRSDDLLQQLKIDVRAFNDAEADCIADDFDYFYKKYFSSAFPTYIGKIIYALIKKGKRKEAKTCLDLIVEHKQKMEQKCSACEQETNRRGKRYSWSINWNTGAIREPVYDKNLNKSVIMRDKIMAYVWGVNERPFIIGNAIVITQEDLAEIGFADSGFLADLRQLDIMPTIDEQLLKRLLENDDVAIFEAFTKGQEINAELERLILNSNGKIRAKYVKTNTPKSINDAIATGDVDLVLSMLSAPQATLQYSKEVDIALLSSEKILPVLKKFIPFLGKDQLDALLNKHVENDNIQARILLIEAGAKVLTQHMYSDYEGGTYCEWNRDDLQTEILYKVLKSEVK